MLGAFLLLVSRDVAAPKPDVPKTIVRLGGGRILPQPAPEPPRPALTLLNGGRAPVVAQPAGAPRQRGPGGMGAYLTLVRACPPIAIGAAPYSVAGLAVAPEPVPPHPFGPDPAPPMPPFPQNSRGRRLPAHRY